MAFGGGQAGAFGVQLDGASAGTNRAGSTLWAAVNAPSLDAITEFAVETNGFKAEFGRVKMRKPPASRARSAEMYLLATGRRIL